MDYGVLVPGYILEVLRCPLCHFGQVPGGRGLCCMHPEGAAIKRYPEQPAGFNRGTICKNWKEDYSIKIPARLSNRN